MEWNGMEWNGMAWHGMAWHNLPPPQCHPMNESHIAHSSSTRPFPQPSLESLHPRPLPSPLITPEDNPTIPTAAEVPLTHTYLSSKRKAKIEGHVKDGLKRRVMEEGAIGEEAGFGAKQLIYGNEGPSELECSRMIIFVLYEAMK
ncbi:unnamed protein product [Cercopithifilaria johnstoni]|uniref:Uncharacterized protein n=1 Tax=Cercopithifilaria johnstoni TaxID=2874296 RepID=A0A8J2LTC7_9BILA|nr:unnamed protein product [Cercopithifilaria johnstoni]